MCVQENYLGNLNNQLIFTMSKNCVYDTASLVCSKSIVPTLHTVLILNIGKIVWLKKTKENGQFRILHDEKLLD